MAEYLVAGLGNIGSEYAATRHNMGFMVLDAWAQASNAVFSVDRYGSVADISFKGRHFHLLKPSTYMNLSGNAVRYWMQKLNIPQENLIVVSDDLNLPFGTIRMREGGSAGGHNGLQNIIDMLGTDAWARIRVGIGSEFSRGGQVDYVLGGFSPEEMEQIPEIAAKIVLGIKDFSTVGPQKAMSFLNSKTKKDTKEAKSASETPEN